MEYAVILAGARTSIGAFSGSLAGFTASQLGSIAIKEALTRAGVDPAEVDEVLMGNVLTAAQGQAPARQAARRAGLPDATGAVTLNTVCGSGMRAVMLAHDMLRAGSAEVLLAGGMESMSQAPHLASVRAGVKAGGIWGNHNRQLAGVRVSAGLKAGGLWGNHNRAVRS